MELHARPDVSSRSADAGCECQRSAGRHHKIFRTEKRGSVIAPCPRRKYPPRSRLPLSECWTDRGLSESGAERPGYPELPEVRRTEPAEPERHRCAEENRRPKIG